MSAVIEFLKKVSFLSGLPESALVRLAARELRFAAHEMVVGEGDAANDLFIIKSGSVDVVKGRGMNRQVIAARGPGDLVGEMGLFYEQRRYASVVAREPAEIIAIPYQTFRAVVSSSSEAVYALFNVVMQLSRKLAQAQDQRLRAAQRPCGEGPASAGPWAFVGACLSRLLLSVDNLVGAAESAGLGGGPPGRGRFDLLWAAVCQVQRQASLTAEFAGLVASQGVMLRRQVDFGDLARGVVAEMGQAAGVAQEIAAGVTLVGDGAKLAGVMSCLLRSAVEANGGGAALTVRVFQDGDAAHYEVRDAGGRTPVDRFLQSWNWGQAVEALARGEEGEGLATMLAQYVVSAHGGGTWGRREKTGGVSLGFWVPLSDDCD